MEMGIVYFALATLFIGLVLRDGRFDKLSDRVKVLEDKS